MDAPRPDRMSAPGKTEPTEEIARARAGDADAWGELYREYAPAMFRFCRRALPTREDAEDATMEIFMKLRDKRAQITVGICFDAVKSARIKKPRMWRLCHWSIRTRISSIA